MLSKAGFNPLTAVHVYNYTSRRMTPPLGWRIYTHLTYSHFSSTVADSANSSFCSPLGSISWMSGYKYSAKPRLRSPKARAYASKLESEVAVNFAMLVAPDSPIGDASKMFFQTTTVPISGFLVSLKVMYGRVESARDTWSGCEGNKDPPKVWWCAIRRSTIGDRRSAIAENVDNMGDRFGGTQISREEGVDRSDGFDGD